MALQIKYTSECECGEQLSMLTLDLSQNPGTQVEINLDMVGEFTLECGYCRRNYYVPALSDYIMEAD